MQSASDSVGADMWDTSRLGGVEIPPRRLIKLDAPKGANIAELERLASTASAASDVPCVVVVVPHGHALTAEEEATIEAEAGRP